MRSRLSVNVEKVDHKQRCAGGAAGHSKVVGGIVVTRHVLQRTCKVSQRKHCGYVAAYAFKFSRMIRSHVQIIT